MLNTVLFDMGGTLEDIWNTQETQAKAMDALQKTLRAHGLEPGEKELTPFHCVWKIHTQKILSTLPIRGQKTARQFL